MDHFGALGTRRHTLFWIVATRRQMDRWEPLVAEFLRHQLRKKQLPGELIWQGEAERHMAVVAARNLVRCVEDLPAPVATLDPGLAQRIKDARDLLEHWDDNAPVFNVTPTQERPPRSSGRRFLEQQPGRSPYCWWRWTNHDGAFLAPGLPAEELREALDRAQREVLDADPELARFVPAANPSPWRGGSHWPR